MFAILKNHRGTPEALFAIERETPKRYYGTLADTLQRDSWFWLTGFTKGARGNDSFVTKEIVMCVINSDNPWHAAKTELQRIEAAHKSRHQAIQSDLNDARETARTLEIENHKAARNLFRTELEKYVCQADML